MEKKGFLGKIDTIYAKITKKIMGDVSSDTDASITSPLDTIKTFTQNNIEKIKKVGIKETMLTIGTPLDEKALLYSEVIKREKHEAKEEAKRVKSLAKAEKEKAKALKNNSSKQKSTTTTKKTTKTKTTTTSPKKKTSIKTAEAKSTTTKKTANKTSSSDKKSTTKKKTTTTKKPTAKATSSKKTIDKKVTETKKKTTTSSKTSATKKVATAKKVTKASTEKSVAKKPTVKTSSKTTSTSTSKKPLSKKATTKAASSKSEIEKKAPTKKTSAIKSTTTKTTPPGSKRAEKIALYIKDIKKHYGEVDEAFVVIIVKNLGPSIYRKDAETVACSDPKELDTVRKNFLIKKLGIDASQGVLDAAIQDVCTELKGVRTKYRATFYYALAKKFKKESVLS